MASKTVHWFKEWILSHLLWEGFKYIIPATWSAAVIALAVTAIRWLGGHPNTVMLVGSSVGIVLFTALYAARENARKVRPVLKLGEARTQGLYDIYDFIAGFTVRVRNDQHKFDTVAHNLRASLHFQHTLGDKVKTFPALWVVNDHANAGKRKLTDSISLGMAQEEWLLVLFYTTNIAAPGFMTTSKIPLSPNEASRLIAGEWKVKVVLEADNARSVVNTRLLLGPHAVTMEPI